MSIADLDIEPVEPPTTNGDTAPTAPAPEWKVRASDGKQYIPRPAGKSGIIIRQGEETIAQALERDALPRDKRPRRRSKTPKKPDPPKQVDLKALEAALAEALKQPALACALAGDEWGADHFTNAGPYLARNLIVASEHNPWLRRKLEEMATGQDAMMKVVSMVGVGGGIFLYVVPPAIYWFNLPVPDTFRQKFGIPPRREQKPPYAGPTPVPTPPDPVPT